MQKSLFFKMLNYELARATGPVAQILISEEISDMGEDYYSFPQQRISDLVYRLSIKIPRKEKKTAFQLNMTRFIINTQN